MSLRNNGGHYTAAALRTGYRDQYAVHRSYGLVRVELSHAEEGVSVWHVALLITRPGYSESVDKGFATLDEARREYRRLVRKHP